MSDLLVVFHRQGHIANGHERRADHSPRKLGIDRCQREVDGIFERLDAALTKILLERTIQHHYAPRALKALPKHGHFIRVRPCERAIVRLKRRCRGIEPLEKRIELFDGRMVTPRNEVLQGRSDMRSLRF